MKKLITLLTLTITILLNGNQLYAEEVAEEVAHWKSIEDAQFKYSADLYDLSEKQVLKFLPEMAGKKENKKIEKEIKKKGKVAKSRFKLIGLLNEEQAKAFAKKINHHKSEKNIDKQSIKLFKWGVPKDSPHCLDLRIATPAIATELTIYSKHVIVLAYKEEGEKNYNKILLFQPSRKK